MERVLITGANGFVGRHLISYLAQTEPAWRLIGLIRPEEHSDAIVWSASRADLAQSEWLSADIADVKSVANAVAAAQPTVVIHLAARSSGADRDRDAVWATNVGGSRHLLEACSVQQNCRRVLMVSTGYVYGSTDPSRPAEEADPLCERGKFGLYADSKAEMERICREYADKAIIVRPFTHTGPGQASNFAVSSFARQIAEIEKGLREPVVSVGNLEALRDMLHVKDVVRAYAGLICNGVQGTAYNVAASNPVSIRAMLDLLISESPASIEVTVDPERLRPADIACSSGSYARLHALLGWMPQLNLQQTLKDTLNYWRMCV